MSAKAQSPQRVARESSIALIIGLLAVAESFGSTLLYHPHGLSYYSPVIGGLPGATKAGFEPTYFFDGVTPEVRDWLADHTTGAPYVLVRNNATWLSYLQDWRQLKVETRPNHWKMTPIFVVYQNRPGLFDPLDRKLISEAKPAYTKTLFGVPIVMIYPYETWQAVRQAQATSSNK